MTTDKAKTIAALKRQLKSTTNQTLKNALTKKISRLTDEMKADKIPAKQMAMQLFKARNDINAMSKSDFNAMLKRLAMKPEYSFLKGMTKEEVKDDIERPAKPVGWRFKGASTRKPTKAEVREGVKKGNVYYENRRNHSDVVRPAQLETGGGVGKTKHKKGDKNKPFVMFGGVHNENQLDSMEDFIKIQLDPEKFEKYVKGLKEKGYNNPKHKENPHYEWAVKRLAQFKSGELKPGERKPGVKSRFANKYAQGGGLGKINVGDTFASHGLPYSLIVKSIKNGNAELYKLIYYATTGTSVLGQKEFDLSLVELQRMLDNKEWRRVKVKLNDKDKGIMAQGGKFGMLSVKAGIDNNPNPTYADKIAGATHKFAKGGGVGVEWTVNFSSENDRKTKYVKAKSESQAIDKGFRLISEDGEDSDDYQVESVYKTKYAKGGYIGEYVVEENAVKEFIDKYGEEKLYVLSDIVEKLDEGVDSGRIKVSEKKFVSLGDWYFPIDSANSMIRYLKEYAELTRSKELEKELEGLDKMAKGGGVETKGKTNKEISDMYWQKAEDIDEEINSDRGGETSGPNWERIERLERERDKYRNLSIKYDNKMAQGGGVDDYTKSLGMVKVKFADPKYNYETSVSGSLTEKDVRDYFVGKSFNVAAYPNEVFEKVVDVEFFPKGTYAEGGMMDANEENREMVVNNNIQIMHHTHELKEAVKKAKYIPAWVVAKVFEATSALSNVTHYLDGTTKMATGGGVGKDRYILSFNYNPSIVKNEYAEGIVSKYTKDWNRDNDWDEVTFYVQGLTKQQASELRSELKMEDVYNIEIEKGRYTYSKGGGVGLNKTELLRKNE